MTPTQHRALHKVLRDVAAERARQHAVHGEQELGFGTEVWDEKINRLLDQARRWQQMGSPTWNEILIEEVCEAHLAETDEEREVELLQVAAVAVQAVECIRRKRAAKQEAA